MCVTESEPGNGDKCIAPVHTSQCSATLVRMLVQQRANARVNRARNSQDQVPTIVQNPSEPSQHGDRLRQCLRQPSVYNTVFQCIADYPIVQDTTHDGA